MTRSCANTLKSHSGFSARLSHCSSIVQNLNSPPPPRDLRAFLLPPELIYDCERLCDSTSAARQGPTIVRAELKTVCQIIENMRQTVESSKVPAERFDMSGVRGVADMLRSKWSLPDRMLRAALELLEDVCQRELGRSDRSTDVNFLPPSRAAV